MGEHNLLKVAAKSNHRFEHNLRSIKTENLQASSFLYRSFQQEREIIQMYSILSYIHNFRYHVICEDISLCFTYITVLNDVTVYNL